MVATEAGSNLWQSFQRRCRWRLQPRIKRGPRSPMAGALSSSQPGYTRRIRAVVWTAKNQRGTTNKTHEHILRQQQQQQQRRRWRRRCRTHPVSFIEAHRQTAEEQVAAKTKPLTAAAPLRQNVDIRSVYICRWTPSLSLSWWLVRPLLSLLPLQFSWYYLILFYC